MSRTEVRIVVWRASIHVVEGWIGFEIKDSSSAVNTPAHGAHNIYLFRAFKPLNSVAEPDIASDRSDTIADGAPHYGTRLVK
jgi:hypothetical protein